MMTLARRNELKRAPGGIHLRCFYEPVPPDGITPLTYNAEFRVAKTIRDQLEHLSIENRFEIDRIKDNLLGDLR
jgi:hypothetical protein